MTLPKETSVTKDESSDSNHFKEISGDESSQSGSSLDTNTKSSSDQHSELKERLAEQESKQVFRLRLLVIVILTMAAVAVSWVVHSVSSGGEEETFELQYEGAATKVIDAFLNIADQKIGAAGALVVALVSYGELSGNAWPFVTLSSFQRRAQAVKDQSGVLYIGTNYIVERDLREAWEEFTNTNDNVRAFYENSIQYQAAQGLDAIDTRPQVPTDDPDLNLVSGIANHIYSLDRFQGAKADVAPGKSQYLPVFQVSPMPHHTTLMNQDYSSNSEGLRNCLLHDAVVFEGLQWARPGYASDEDPYTSEIAWLLQMADKKQTMYQGDLFSTVYLPIYDTFEDNRKTVGVVRLVLHWARYFRNILPASTQGVVMVLSDSCSEPYTYIINGPNVEPVGLGDLHDPKYDHLLMTADYTNVSKISDGTEEGMRLFQDACPITISIYPSDEMQELFQTNTPTTITLAVACVFLFTMFMFFFYDRLVERRQKLVLRKAEQTNAIVSSLFPKNVRDRLLEDNHASKDVPANVMTKDSPGINGSSSGAAIADLFPEATVMFCDISGFTAWSSSRDPTQVFILLQSIYQAFDAIAKRRKVFKVETVGDSYVCVTGLPEPQPTHAVIMARFATECNAKMKEVTTKLESTLGPDTADLAMRFGLHSGPVTAGVLQCNGARFQLFGDTVNTAARMESTSKAGMIQISDATAELLEQAGKQNWVRKRDDDVNAKGKGFLKTFWVQIGHKPHEESSQGSGEASLAFFKVATTERSARLVNWMTELFKTYIRDIVAKRAAAGTFTARRASTFKVSSETPLDEVVEVIGLAEFDARSAVASIGQNGADVEFSDEIESLLRDYISHIASMYRDNPFHNFEHACHVTMSCDRFMRKIVAPDMAASGLKNKLSALTSADEVASNLHDYTHGIQGDPVALFAIIYSALIHDVDHRGVSNAQLATELPEMGKKYKGKSVAEQHSLDLAWNHLMDSKYEKLRRFIFGTNDEMARFRQVIVNVVLATDIFDKELNDLRKSRWQKAFSQEGLQKHEEKGLRATIVLEHIIQASDVSHTMQHWHIYRKWNERLFRELTLAFRAGRMGADPAKFWYKGELGFFDNYVIPLAKKLKECRVFGSNSDQCLVYALKNRDEWELKGADLVDQMIMKMSEEEEAAS